MKLQTKIFVTAAATIIGSGLIGAALAAHVTMTDPAPVINPEPEYNRDVLLAKIEAERRAREIEVLKQYEQADFDFMRGDAELPEK